jgi:NAD(P)-dependent dehydrogenase (short-subunit alcohol dehydrogenase family)
LKRQQTRQQQHCHPRSKAKQVNPSFPPTSCPLELTSAPVLITGVTYGGLGFEAARAIAHKEPRLLILAGRSAKNNEDAASRIAKEVPVIKTKTLTLDLGTFKTVRDAAKEFNSWDLESGLDILINNAAIM